MARLELVRRLAAAVAELAEPYRGVLVARYFDGLEPPEIARRDGAPLATVHTQLRRGRELLRERLLPREDPKARAMLLAGLDAVAGASAATAVATKMTALWMFGRVAAAAIVIGLGAWGIGVWAWPPPQDPGETVAATSSRRPDPADVATNAAPPATPAVVRVASAAGEVASEERAPVAAQVVFQESGEPAAGASVEWKEIGTTRLERERFTFHLYSRHPNLALEDDDQRRRDYEETIESAGGAFQRLGATDADGVITLPPFEDAVVRVTLGDRRLLQRVSSTDLLPLRLELERRAAFTIRVVDRRGAPAPATSVVIEGQDNGSKQSHWRGRTGADGTVAVAMRHFDQLRHWRSAQRSVEYAVTLGLAAADAPRVPIDLDELPTEPIELVLPPAGRLRIEVLDRDGRPFAGTALVGVQRVDRERGQDPSAVGMSTCAIDAGIAEFESVALGLDLWVQPIDIPRSHEAPWQTIAGPTREGETTIARVQLGAALPRVSGRVIQADGTPLRQWYFRCRYSIASSPHTGRVVTDADGRFRLPIMRYPNETTDTSRIPVDVGWLTLVPAKVALLDPALAESAIVLPIDPPLLEPGEHDLGDLVLEGSRVIAAGKVVDNDGIPLDGVSVAAMAYCNEQWMKVAELEATSGEDGRFAITGHTRLTPLRLTVPSAGWRRRDVVEFTPGARDLVVVALPASTLAGQLLLDPGIPIDQLVVRPSESLQSLADVRELIRQGTAPFTLAADGRWRLIGLGERRGTLVVGLGNGIAGHFAIEPLVQIDDVSSGAAGATDPRLATIDLRGTLRVIDLEVNDAVGAPLAATRIDARAVATDGALGARRTLLTDRHGRARLLAAAATYALTASKQGYVEQALPAVAAARTITLERLR